MKARTLLGIVFNLGVVALVVGCAVDDQDPELLGEDRAAMTEDASASEPSTADGGEAGCDCEAVACAITLDLTWKKAADTCIENGYATDFSAGGSGGEVVWPSLQEALRAACPKPYCPSSLDSGTKDSGTKDSGTKDSGTKDSGTKDSGTKDSGAKGSG